MEFLSYSAAAFRESGIANLAAIQQHLATGQPDSLGNMWRGFLRDALVALAVVIGTHIKEGMVLTVVPANQRILLLGEREEIVAALSHLSALLHLRQQPRTRNHGMRLQQFETRCGTHLAADYTLQIALHRQFVDGIDLIRFHHEAEGTQEGLRLLALPVEVHADGYVADRERGVVALRMEGELTVKIAVPHDAALKELHLLLANHDFALSQIRLVQREMHLLGTHDAHGNLWFLLIII